MVPAPVPENEKARMRELHRLGVLDPAMDHELQSIVEVASSISGCPISLISLVDSDRQFFKAKKGLEATETARDISFCGHAIQKDSPFIVKDAKRDERFQDNPLVTGDPSVRFYAGFPLTTSAGFRIGTLCTIDQTPRELTQEQSENLQKLAHQAITLIELKLKKRQFMEANEELEREKEMRERFINAMTHDLRSPLASVKMNLQMMERFATDGKMKGLSVKSQRSIDRLNEMIQNLLDAALISSGEALLLKIEHGDLEGALRDPLEGMARPQDQGLDVRFAPGDYTGYFDLNSLHRVCENLITNAFKYGSGERPVEVRFESSEENVRFGVRNFGNPIPAKDQPLLFNQFYRSADNSKHLKSWGIGLSVCKGIVEGHGGTLSLSSTQSDGTIFSVSLPRFTSK